jgi:hypothetical protein
MTRASQRERKKRKGEKKKNELGKEALSIDPKVPVR